MTDRFKEALEAIDKAVAIGTINSCYWAFENEHKQAIREALTLATEVEQLRKERDEYKHKYELTRAGCKNTDIKDNENGNA